MRITQGTFSFLPDLTDDEISAQLAYCLEHGWSISVEYTDDPHPRNTYWEMWGLPMFDLTSPASAMDQLRACRAARPDDYVRVNAYDRQLGRQTTALSFIAQRPAVEAGFSLERTEEADRCVRYTLHHRGRNP